MQRVEGVIERRLSEETNAMVRTLVTEQLQTVHLRLRQELEIVIRQVVAEVLMSRESPYK